MLEGLAYMWVQFDKKSTEQFYKFTLAKKEIFSLLYSFLMMTVDI